MKPEPTDTPPKPKGKVFDVMRPGRAPASPTSRPGIIGHPPEVKNTFSGVSGIGDARPLLNPKQKVAINPIEESETEAPVVKEDAPVIPEAEVSEEKQPQTITAVEVGASALSDSRPKEPAEAAEPEAPQEETPEPAAPAPEPKAPTPLSEQPMHKPDLPGGLLQDADAPDEEAGYGEVVVSHHRNNASMLKILLLVVIVLLLLAAAFDILLDAGVLSMSGIPHTSFFN